MRLGRLLIFVLPLAASCAASRPAPVPVSSPRITAEMRATADLAAHEARRDSAERAWFEGERKGTMSADLEALVRSSDAIVIAEFPTCPPKVRTIWLSDHSSTTEWYPPCGNLRVLEWLRATRVDEPDSLIGIFLGQREDSLRRHWAPEQHPYRETKLDPRRRFVAFLRLASDPSYREKMRNYRPTDHLNGFLLAEDSTVAEVRSEVVRMAGEMVVPRSGCDASLAEFTHLDSTSAASVGAKLSRTTPLSWRTHLSSLVIGSSSLQTSWFAPCLRPDHAYEIDYHWSSFARASPGHMSRLLDSLATVSALQQRRSSAADTLTITLRRVTERGERIFECSLDQDSYHQVARILANLFPTVRQVKNGRVPQEVTTSWNVRVWISQVDWKTADRYFGKK